MKNSDKGTDKFAHNQIYYCFFIERLDLYPASLAIKRQTTSRKVHLMCNRSKKSPFSHKETPLFSKKTAFLRKKTAIFFGENEDFENQPFVKADFLLENPLDNSPFQQNNSAFCPTETPNYFLNSAFCFGSDKIWAFAKRNMGFCHCHFGFCSYICKIVTLRFGTVQRWI